MQGVPTAPEIEPSEVFTERLMGSTKREIAQRRGVTEQAIHARLQKEQAKLLERFQTTLLRGETVELAVVSGDMEAFAEGINLVRFLVHALFDRGIKVEVGHYSSVDSAGVPNEDAVIYTFSKPSRNPLNDKKYKQWNRKPDGT